MTKRMIVMATTAILVAAGPAAVGEWRYAGSAEPNSGNAEPAPGKPASTAAGATGPAAPAGGVPTNFMSMNTVTKQFGEPEKRAPSVGQPPITRWYYPRYTVYFEHDRVIISVVH